MTILPVLMMLACGDKTENDTALASSVEGTENGSEGSGSNGSGNDGDGNNGENGENTGDPNEDMDGDGFIGADDCDDTDPYTYPGATEFPGDGIDQDCDGSEPSLNKPGQPLGNASFDNQDGGIPTDWQQAGAGWAWQADGTEIFNVNGGTGEMFAARSGAGSLKLWGDYGNDTFADGVYQEFMPSGGWLPANQKFWIDAWVMVHQTDPLQNEAKVVVGIRCLSEFFGTFTVEAESYSASIDLDAELNVWTRVWATVECPIETSVVRPVLLFGQSGGADSQDHGAVFVDDVAFGTL